MIDGLEYLSLFQQYWGNSQKDIKDTASTNPLNELISI